LACASLCEVSSAFATLSALAISVPPMPRRFEIGVVTAATTTLPADAMWCSECCGGCCASLDAAPPDRQPTGWLATESSSLLPGGGGSYRVIGPLRSHCSLVRA